MIPRILLAAAALCIATVIQAQQDLGNLSSNPYATDSTANPYGAGNPYSPNSINNQYGTYGNPHSSKSVTNPYATDTPKLYDSEGNYRGKLSSNPYDPESVSNPYGRYGNPHSADSINNPYGAGNPHRADSPTNPYGTGWKIVDDEESSDDDPIYASPDYGYSLPDNNDSQAPSSYEYESPYESDSTDLWGDDADDDSGYSWDDY